MKKTSIKLLVFFLVSAFLLQSVAAQEAKTAANDQIIKCEVETAVSMLNAIYAKHTGGEITLEKAKIIGADLLRELRYGTEGYFWADTKDGVNVVLYGREDVEGKNRLEARDEKGNYYIKNILAKARDGGGYTEYWFTKKGETTARPKRSYVMSFEPFDWVIGTGYYP